MSNWQNAVINVMEDLKNDFRVITMDQRNAPSGESTGPVPVDNPWDAFADDQLGLMDHLGIRQFLFFGNCIGGPFAMKLMQRAPERVVAAVLSQPIGTGRKIRTSCTIPAGTSGPRSSARAGPRCRWRPSSKYLHDLYRVQPDFVYSVSRDFAKSCETPMLVLPDDVAAHPLQVSIDIASLAPNAEMTVFPWKEPAGAEGPHHQPRTTFLKRYQTA